MKLTNEEKIMLLEDWIKGLDFHIENLKNGIDQYPDSDIDGKTPRTQVLNDLLNTKAFYIKELFNLKQL